MNNDYFFLSKELVAEVVEHWPLKQSPIHGPEHWMSVSRNAQYLLSQEVTTSAEAIYLLPLVKLFALFHDSCRMNEGYDETHGIAATQYFLRRWVRLVSEAGVDVIGVTLLTSAMSWHTTSQPLVREFNPSVDCLFHKFVGICLDADRLDLRRLGITPDVRFLFTNTARRIAASNKYEELDGFCVTNSEANS